VEMVYRPWSVPAGALLSGAALACWLGGRLWSRKRERRGDTGSRPGPAL
jgi:hypothetical protein